MNGTLDEPTRDVGSRPDGQLTAPDRLPSAAVIVPRDASRAVQEVVRALKERVDTDKESGSTKVINSGGVPASAIGLRDLIARINALENQPVSQATQQTITPAQTIPAYSLVAVSSSGAVLADNTILEHKYSIIGMATESIPFSTSGAITTFGTVENIGWMWTPGDILYLSTLGQLTTTPNTGLFTKPVAVALSQNKIFVAFDTAKQSVYVQDTLPVVETPALLIRSGQYTDPDLYEFWGTL